MDAEGNEWLVAHYPEGMHPVRRYGDRHPRFHHYHTFVAIEPPVRTASYSEVIDGDGSEDEFEIEHELGSTDVVVSIYNNANHALVLTSLNIVDADTVVVSFDVAPETGDHFKVVVIG